MTEASSFLCPLKLEELEQQSTEQLSQLAQLKPEWDLSPTQITEIMSGYQNSPMTANTALQQKSKPKRASKEASRIKHLYETQANAADILREHADKHKQMQDRIRVLEALVLELCAHREPAPIAHSVPPPSSPTNVTNVTF